MDHRIILRLWGKLQNSGPETKIISILSQILKDLIRLTKAEAGVFYLHYLQEEKMRGIHIATVPADFKKAFKPEIGKYFLTRIIQDKLKYVTSTRTDYYKNFMEYKVFKHYNFLIIPLFPHKNIKAAIEIFGRRSFTFEMISVFTEIKKNLENFLVNYYRSQMVQTKLMEFSKLIDISAILNSTLNINILLSRIISQARKVMDSQGCSLMLVDPETNELVFKTIKGKKSQLIKEFRIPYGKGIAGWIVKHKKAVIVNDVKQDKRFYSESDTKSGFKTRNILGVPLIAKGDVIGVIEAVNKHRGRSFTDSDRDFFITLANQIAIAVQNAQYYTELRSQFLSVVRSLTAAIDAKDPTTRGHSERVTKYSVLLAKALKLPSQEVERIQLSALLHDIGKIGVDEDILRKPARLTDAEFKEIQRHPVIGEEIMKPIIAMKIILPGIRNHHERWDGKGYPDGLAGEKIPFFGRLIALADAFDAITSDRPYRKKRKIKIALDEIKRCSGSQFDPELARVFIKAVRSRKEKLIVIGEIL
ncbi:MAG: GAF domain-containing protein [Spirochaetes bacterium]|nr:GAF domain-containing protein [Spirochaetota bacterium]